MWFDDHEISVPAIIMIGLIDDGELNSMLFPKVAPCDSVKRPELEILFHWFGFEEESTSVLLGVEYGLIPSLRNRERATEVSDRKW